MAILTNGDTLNTTLTLTKPTNTTITFKTQEQYVEKDIALTVDTLVAQPSIVQDESSNHNIQITNSSLIFGETDKAKIAITPTAALTHGTIHYAQPLNGWVRDDEHTQLVAPTEESWEGTEQYLNGVILDHSDTKFEIQVPNGPRVGSATIGGQPLGLPTLLFVVIDEQGNFRGIISGNVTNAIPSGYVKKYINTSGVLTTGSDIYQEGTFQPISITGGWEYTLQYWLKGTPSDQYWAEISWYKSSTINSSNFISQVVVGPSDEKLPVTAVAPSTAKYAVVSLRSYDIFDWLRFTI